jgi:hypothetical protein
MHRFARFQPPTAANLDKLVENLGPVVPRGVVDAIQAREQGSPDVPDIGDAAVEFVIQNRVPAELIARVNAAVDYDPEFLGRELSDLLEWAGDPKRRRAELRAVGLPEDFAGICEWALAASGLQKGRVLLAVGKGLAR